MFLGKIKKKLELRRRLFKKSKIWVEFKKFKLIFASLNFPTLIKDLINSLGLNRLSNLAKSERKILVMHNSSSSNLFQLQQTPAISNVSSRILKSKIYFFPDLFNPPPMNSSTNLFPATYQPNQTTQSTGMVLRSGNTTNNQYTGANSTTSFFNTSLNSKNLFTSNQAQSTNNPIFGPSKPSNDIFSGFFFFARHFNLACLF